MKRMFIAMGIAFLLGGAALAMIDSYSYKIIGKVVSMPTKNKPMSLAVLSVVPTEKDSDTWVGRHYLKRTIDVGAVNLLKGKDKKKLKKGAIVIGDFMAVETEVHYQGYRTQYTLKIESVFSGKDAASYFKTKQGRMQKVLDSGCMAGKINVAVVARELKLKALAPHILKSMELLYPKGAWEPAGTMTYYGEGIKTFGGLGYEESGPFLKKILADSDNLEKMDANFKYVQDEAEDAMKKLGYTVMVSDEVAPQSDNSASSVSKEASLFGVGLGMSEARAGDFLGKNVFVGSVGGLNYYSFSDGTKKVGFTAIGDRAAKAIWTSDPAYNVQGVSVNNTTNEAKAVLGEPESVKDAGDDLFLCYPSRNIMIQMSKSKNKVIGIEVYDPTGF